LRDIAIHSLDAVARAGGGDPAATTLTVVFEVWISRPALYLQQLLSSKALLGPELARALIGRVAMPRYMGIVRLAGPTLGVVDILIDTTSTMKNLNVLAVAHHGLASDERSLNALAAAYHCDIVRP